MCRRRVNRTGQRLSDNTSRSAMWGTSTVATLLSKTQGLKYTEKRRAFLSGSASFSCIGVPEGAGTMGRFRRCIYHTFLNCISPGMVGQGRMSSPSGSCPRLFYIDLRKFRTKNRTKVSSLAKRLELTKNQFLESHHLTGAPLRQQPWIRLCSTLMYVMSEIVKFKSACND